MKSLKPFVIILLSACCTVGAGILPVTNHYDSEETRSIDLIFATGFEAPVAAPTLSSETPFSGTLPTLETGHEEVGFTAGDFMVDQTGQAAYTIPIFAGVGSAGVSPKVALQYSSAGGNGHVGVGWSISGVTLISRCRETAESKDVVGDITPSPITYGTEDKFCLNGERLFVSNGGSYGDDGTEYRTEKEQFARITSVGGSGNNPDYFTVERKDGSKSFYGNTTDSNITVLHSDPGINGKTYTWAINRYQDTMSNYIDYSYNKLADGEFVLTDIDYTGNVTQALAPYNNISFIYETRTDEFSSFLGGVEFATTQRLASIESRIDGTLVRDYTLLYDLSTTTFRSILTSIQECRGATCFPASNFTWSEPNKQIRATDTGAYVSFPTDVKSSKLGDVNADGRADLVFVDDNTDTFKVALANGQTGFGIATTTTISAPAGTEIDNKWHLIDYNADGREDLMIQVGTSWVVHLASTGTVGFSSVSTSTGLTGTANSDFQIIDMNGDGLADLLYPVAGLSVRYLERQGGSYAFSNTLVGIDLPGDVSQIPEITPPLDPNEYMIYRFHQDDDINVIANDVNGDGVADLILRVDVYYTENPPLIENLDEQAYRFISAGEDFHLQGEPMEVLDSSHWVAFIGNGLAGGDLDYESEHYYIKETSTLLDDADQDIKFIDINADGLTDVFAKNTSNNWQYRLATGKGFTSFSSDVGVDNEDHLQMFDYNLDGYTDVVYPDTTGNQNYLAKIWVGDGFLGTATFIGASAINVNQNLNLFMDLNGDGTMDHVRIDNAGDQNVYPREDVYLTTDQITTFTDGLGASTDVLYRPLTFSSTYKQGNHQTTALNYGLGSPVLDVMGAVYVVRQVDVDSPIEGDESFQNTMRYRYENARIQTGGRGFLGFEKVITATPVKAASDSDAKILESTTTYRQDFPYNGIPSGTQIKQLNDDFYDASNVPPDCGDDDTCFPPPCEPGLPCEDIPRIEENMNLAGTDTTLSTISITPNQLSPTSKSTFPYVQTVTLDTHSPEDGTLLKTETQSTTHDSFGNPLVHTVTIKDGSGTTLQTNTTTNTYSNITTLNSGESRWLIGLLETSTTVKTRTGQLSITTVSEFDYDYTNGLLIEERQDPTGGDELFLRKRYEYDGFGNTTKVITCSGATLTSSQCANNTPTAANAASPYHIHRYERTTFDSKGRYVDETYNTEEQNLTDVLTRDIYGNPLTSIDLLGIITTNAYDDFGRLTSTRNTLGTWTQTSRQWCTGLTDTYACSSGMDAQIRVRKMDAGGSLSYIYMDSLGREVATITQSSNATNDGSTSGDDRYVVNKVWHDQFGRKIKSEGDHFLGASVGNIPVTHTEFDRYNRSTKMILPDTSDEAMSYAGFTTHFTNDAGQRRQEKRNALDQLIEVKDFDIAGANPEYKNTLTYVYDSQGALLNLTRDANNLIERLIENTYDRRGRKTSSDDVDTGFSEIFYNALGEVVETIDAEDNSIKTYYDTLGRAHQVESWDDTVQLTRNINTYNATNGLLETEAKLTFVGSISYTQSHTYDGFKRPQTTDISFTDADNVCIGLTCDYQANLYYDQFSRLKYQQDASGKATENHYNARGFLSHVTDAADGTKEYYRINQTDKWGNVISDRKAGDATLSAIYTFHPTRGWLNSITAPHQQYVYEYDSLGNLVKRSDIGNNQSECFRYDRLNRLTDTYRFNNSGQNCNITTGNVAHQVTGYDAKGNLTSKDGQSYAYLTGNASAIGSSPHQVQSKGAQIFTYDDRGNMTRSTNFRNGQGQLVDRNVAYTGFNKIQRIYTGSNSNDPIDESIYRYNNTEEPYSRTDTNSDDETTVTHFMGNVEVEYNANGQIAFKRHLGNFAVITETNNSTQETYLFHDHLGSVDVITDSSGHFLQAMSFSAWGERRVPANWDDFSSTLSRDYLSDYTTKGFTGHEMLDVFGIINMGGRIYDAELGKMLQADPVVQDPNTSQGFNRYVYVHNNPLSFTDPTGYFSLRKLVAAVVAVTLSFILPGLGFNIFWTAFTVGFTSTYIITGSLRSALRAGLVAGAVAFVGSQFANTGGADAANSGSKAAAGGAGDVATNTAISETAPVSTSASGGASTVAGGINAFDVAAQVISSLDPEAGAVLSFLRGGIIDASGKFVGAGGVVQNLVSHYGKFKATEELERFAKKNGMSLAELNLALVAMSFAGNKLIGTRFYEDNYTDKEAGQGVRGILSRNSGGVIDSRKYSGLNRTIGLVFDLVDIALGFQGLITASGYDAIVNGQRNQTIGGISLGSMDANNLVSRGYFPDGVSKSFVFGNVSHSNVRVELGPLDIVNGGFLGKLLNPSATLLKQPAGYPGAGCALHEWSGCY